MQQYIGNGMQSGLTKIAEHTDGNNFIARGKQEVSDYAPEAYVLDVQAGDFLRAGIKSSDDRKLILFDERRTVCSQGQAKKS